ncbi:MAG: precorrin-6y C5,15-methyltransferase (decarboxylating) subunit CbiE [Desulfococcaceae bacterium]
MKTVSVIGLGLSPADLTAAHLELIGSADILIGGKRHLAYFEDLPCIKKEISKNLSEVKEFIRLNMADKAITVLASGDPLFYGIGSYLVKKIGAENVHIYPNITSVSAAFARIKESWQDACVISMHGQFDEGELLFAMHRENKIALLTDPQHSPAWLGQFLLKKEINDFRMCVLEQLGTDTEKMQWFEAEEAAEKDFAEPNLVILQKTEQASGLFTPEKVEQASSLFIRNDMNKPETCYRSGNKLEACSTVSGNRLEACSTLHLGMPDECFEHEKGLITKSEVRAVTLSKLRLCSPDLILWDLGAGSGSVSVEASLFLPKGKIFTLEQHPERIAQIRENRRRFGVYQMEVIQTVLPDGLENLPRPDRVFIGGGGKNLETIIRTAAGYMKTPGIMVINTVLVQNIQTALDTLQKSGFIAEIIQVQISAGKAMPWGERLAAQNPVWIVTGMRDS